MWMKERRTTLSAIACVLIVIHCTCFHVENPSRARTKGEDELIFASHESLLGGIPHAGFYCLAESSCTECHGSDLKGGADGQPSCLQCHGPVWQLCGQNTPHEVVFEGASHALGYCGPYQNCGGCHGVDLRGGPDGQPSCLVCHDQNVWRNCGAIQHTRRKDGVLHAMDFCKPFRDCSPCHGNQLRGGYNQEISCYHCHGDAWNDEDCSDYAAHTADPVDSLRRSWP